mgnify:CR=1 FL=1
MSVDKTLEKLEKKGGKKRKKFLSKMDKEAKAHEMKDIYGQKFRKRLGATIPDHKRVAKEKQLTKEIDKTKPKKLKLKRATGVTITPKKATAKKAKIKWYQGIGKGRYAKKAISALKKKPKKKSKYGPIEGLTTKKEYTARKTKEQEKADRVAPPKGKKRLTVKQKDKEGKLKDVTYHKYKKGSKTAKDFGSTFKSKCAGKGPGDTFSWGGKSFSCARASDKKKKKTKSISYRSGR